MPSNALQFRLGDVPKAVAESMTQTLNSYCVMLLGLRPVRGDETVTFCGSGTLVSVDAGHYVVTAAHVWETLREFPTVGLTLTEYESRFGIPCDAIDPVVIHGKRSAQWGPDMAFLRLPAPSLGRIKAHKTFFNLSSRRAVMLDTSPDLEVGVWAVVGVPAELSILGRQKVELHGGAFFSAIDATHRRGKFDYLDLAIDLSGRSASPSSCEGLSGGGLWHLPMARQVTDRGHKWQWRHVLEGVAFYQTDVQMALRHVRCHGRASLYGAGLKELGVA